jgi:isopentenyl phosphate kinase
MARPIVLVKLGGSLITDKTRPGAAHRAIIRRLAREIAAWSRRARGARLIVGHGSGSFGHVAAAAGGLTGRGAAPHARAQGISHTQHRAADLHAIVVASLDEAGARPFSLAPSSFMTCARGRVARVFADPLFHALDLGLVPVVYGDVVLDRARGAVVVSTEDVFLALEREAFGRGVPVVRAVWLGATGGVYAHDGATIERLTAAAALRRARAVNGAAGTDVTGGMALRLRAAATLARRGVPSLIVDGRAGGALPGALAGRARGGTRVEVP